MKKKSLIGIGIGAIAIGVFLLAVTNPNLRENKDTYFGFIDTSSQKGEELILPATGEKICCDKYEVINEIMLETVLMPEETSNLYIVKNYKESTELKEECSRLYTQMSKNPIKQKYEPLTDDEYRALLDVFQWVCRIGFEKPPPYSPP